MTVVEDTRNIADELRGIPTSVIRETLRERAPGAAVAMFQIEGDFNFGSVVRNANFFGMDEVYYIGRRKWDRRSAVGTHHYTDVIHCPDLEAFLETVLEKYVPVALENNTDFYEVPLPHYKWPTNPIIIIGEENAGIPDELLQYCKAIVNVPRFGSVRSLNAAVAAGIAMYDYRSQRDPAPIHQIMT